MHPMLAYHLFDAGVATLIAVGLAATLIGVAAITEKLARRRAIHEFAKFPCPVCGNVLGIAAATAGKDVSPFEEIWGDGGTKSWHCHPVCWEVQCSVCASGFVLRLNRSGEKCGPRLAVDSRMTSREHTD